MNFYRFVGNSPGMGVDPWGLFGGPLPSYYLEYMRNQRTPAPAPLPDIGRVPNQVELNSIRKLFPNVPNDRNQIRITDEQTPKYNCHAFASGLRTKTLFDEEALSIEDAIKHYQSLGYKVSKNCNWEKTIKIAIFKGKFPDDSKFKGQTGWTHSAIQTSDGFWESKLGQSFRIAHRLQDLEGDFYGKVVVCMEPAE